MKYERVINGKGEALDLKGYTVLPVSLGKNLVWHEISVVPNLHLEADVLADVTYRGRRFGFSFLLNPLRQRQQEAAAIRNYSCVSCNFFRNDPKVGIAVQMRFVDRIPR